MKTNIKEQNRTKSFDNWRHNGVKLRFPNGNEISTIWGRGSYSENKYLESYQTFLGSNTVEVMISCGDRLHKRLHKKFEGDGSVIGYLDINDWLYIVNAVARENKTKPTIKGVKNND